MCSCSIPVLSVVCSLTDILATDHAVKTYDIKEVDLIKSAEQLIASSPLQNNADCFIPYIDDSTNEIRYLHFVLSGENWICENGRGVDR